jgi:hypothetical protein
VVSEVRIHERTVQAHLGERIIGFGYFDPPPLGRPTLLIKQIVDEHSRRAEPSRQIILFGCLLEQNKFIVITRAEICGGDAMKTRCDHCCGAFGLVRRRHFGHQFCCEACEEAYKEERARMAAQLKSSFYPELTNPNST